MSGERCPRPGCGGLLAWDDDFGRNEERSPEYVCKACARRFTPARLQALREAAVPVPAPAARAAEDEDPALDKRLEELLADDDVEDDEGDASDDDLGPDQDEDREPDEDPVDRALVETKRASRGTRGRKAETPRPDAETKEEPMARSGWTEERRKKFAATMAAKRNGRKTNKTAGGGHVPTARRGRPRSNGGGFDEAQPAAAHNGHLTETWTERKQRMLAELEEAEAGLEAELAKVRKAKEEIAAL